MLQSKAGYIDARPLTASSAKPLATHGRTIQLGQTEKNSVRAHVFRFAPRTRTLLDAVSMSQTCQQQKCRSVCWQSVSSRQARNFEFELVLSAFVATALQCNLIRLPPR